MIAKSKAVRELIDIIYHSPEIFKADSGSGFSSSAYEIVQLRNTRFLSVARLYIEGTEFTLSYRDSWALEVAYLWWCGNVPLTGYVDR